MDEKKVGLYICTGCGIGDALDIEQLGENGTEERPVAVLKNHPKLCSKEGADLIKQDIDSEGINTVIVGACSPPRDV